ncbi:phospholipid/cholesterol/gamma-HCH transport system substrate-binding protein [Amycolatopsis marina]|uniref:Phospholipid/cholesterol/gamma-HCH transport system substrate-binding protein n=1 Tax=Amycolatopsis marina TaxID=490629 RepID=A0A1I0YIX8_9PSEU|nr:MCE family protein [Amycolatopsis marina]SFB13319.1 phospholipid/cholesterol/gamma-HCH transport system substrate-binding protein [Amycolatopsis marina]
MAARQSRRRARTATVGGLAAVCLAAVAALVVGNYMQLFTPVVTVTVIADRAGLMTDLRSDVTFRGVTIGEIRGLDNRDDQVHIEIALRPEAAAQVPADVSGRILAPTVFGAKYLELIEPGTSTGPELRDGDVITPATAQVEINSVFDSLMSLLSSIDVSKLNGTLGGLSATLSGRGEQTGRYITELNGYLREFNAHLANLHATVDGTGPVARLYAGVAPDLVATLDNVVTTARTLVEKAPELESTLAELTTLANSGRALFAENGEHLRAALAELTPTMELLSTYSGIIPCTLDTANRIRVLFEQAVGTEVPGISLYIGVQPAQPGYRYPHDLPTVPPGTGPSCYGAPHSPEQLPSPYVNFADGSEIYPSKEDSAEIGEPLIVTQLFGPELSEVLTR